MLRKRKQISRPGGWAHGPLGWALFESYEFTKSDPHPQAIVIQAWGKTGITDIFVQVMEALRATS